MNNQNIRYERKIYIDTNSIDQIQALIKTHPYGFKEIYYKRKVNSVYYDSPDLNSFWDNELGSAKRAKTRVRWYGDQTTIPLENSNLEIKIKHGIVGDKITTPWKNIEDQSILEKINNIEPVILITYERSYFQSFDKRFRITLDSNIAYSKTNGTTIDSVIYRERGCVLEVKYINKFDNIAKDIINYLPGRVTKFSKYARGIMQVYGG